MFCDCKFNMNNNNNNIIIIVTGGGSRSSSLSEMRRDPRANDRQGFQSISSDAASCRTTDQPMTSKTPQHGGGGGMSRAAVRGILKKTPASVSSLRLGLSLVMCE